MHHLKQVFLGLLLVAGVIAASFFVSRECGISGNSTRCDSSPSTVNRLRINQLYCRLDEFYRACGFYPPARPGLRALSIPLADIPSCRHPLPVSILPGGMPLDAYGRPFVYEPTLRGYTLSSLGKDGKKGNAGKKWENADYGMTVKKPPASLFNGKMLFSPSTGFHLCTRAAPDAPAP